MLPSLTLVLGGAASGKSAFAESIIDNSGLNPIYLATAQSFDAEMDHKIILHKSRRGTKWRLIEAPEMLNEAVGKAGSEDIMLLDCATMWLSNRMMREAPIDRAGTTFLEEIAGHTAPIVVVSNEVGQGIVPDNAMARAFREAQGRLNIDIAARADLVVHVVAGLPNVLKGTLP